MKKAAKKVLQAVQQLTAWSFSRWNDYTKCPALAKYKHIDHLQEPDNKYTEHGTIVHDLAKQYVRGQLTQYPAELGTKFKARFAKLVKVKAIAEQQWAFTDAWMPTSWFAKNAWVRMIVDCHYLLKQVHAEIVDYKTGKEHNDHAMQRALYAAGAFSQYPLLKTVGVEHWYLESGRVGRTVFKRAQLDHLITQWEQRTRAMLNDTRFAPQANSNCKWCHFRNENKGPCEF